MSAALTIVLLWFAFAATHLALSSLRLRPRLVGVLGEGGFMGAYSLVALATFVPMVSIYFGNKHTGPMFWSVAVTPLISSDTVNVCEPVSSTSSLTTRMKPEMALSVAPKSSRLNVPLPTRAPMIGPLPT